MCSALNLETLLTQVSLLRKIKVLLELLGHVPLSYYTYVKSILPPVLHIVNIGINEKWFLFICGSQIRKRERSKVEEQITSNMPQLPLKSKLMSVISSLWSTTSLIIHSKDSVLLITYLLPEYLEHWKYIITAQLKKKLNSQNLEKFQIKPKTLGSLQKHCRKNQG